MNRYLSLAPLLLPVIAPLARSNSQGPPPQAVRVDEVRSETIVAQRRVTGDVRALRRAPVAAREPGRVVELAIREGQRVDLGAVLGRLDARTLELEAGVLRARTSAADASRTEALISLERARRDLETLRRLSERDAANPKELADAESDVALAEARLQLADAERMRLTAELALLEQRIDDTVLRAPFAGVVVQRLAEVGAWLGVGDGVVELLSDRELEVWLDVSEHDLGALRASLAAGESLHVVLESTGAERDLAQARLVPLIDPRSRQFRLVATWPLIDGAADAVAGMSAVGWVPTGTNVDALTVSPDAVLRNEVGPYVWLVRETSPDAPAVAAPQQVDVLYRSGGRVVVRSAALSPGTQVVIEGNERLFPGAPVIPMREQVSPVGGEGGSGSKGARR